MVFYSFKHGTDNAKSKVSKSYEPHDKKVQTSKKVHSEALSPLVKQTLCSKQTDLLFRANRAFIQSKQTLRLKNILLIGYNQAVISYQTTA